MKAQKLPTHVTHGLILAHPRDLWCIYNKFQRKWVFFSALIRRQTYLCCFINMENAKTLLPLVFTSEIFKRADWLKTFNMRLYTNILIVIINVVYRFFYVVYEYHICFCSLSPYLAHPPSPGTALFFIAFCVYWPSHLVRWKQMNVHLIGLAFITFAQFISSREQSKNNFGAMLLEMYISSIFYFFFWWGFFLSRSLFWHFPFLWHRSLRKRKTNNLYRIIYKHNDHFFHGYIRKKRTLTQAHKAFSHPLPLRNTQKEKHTQFCFVSLTCARLCLAILIDHRYVRVCVHFH